MPPWKEDPADVRPMLASIGDATLDDPTLAYEPKYDGIRAIAFVDGTNVRLWSRLGNDKTSQFPEIAATLAAWGPTVGRPVVLDGEIVALGVKGQPIGFQNLQGRIHQKAPPSHVADTAFIVFDLLRDGPDDLRPTRLCERRQRLEQLLGAATSVRLRLSEQATGRGGRALQTRAEALGWEGLIAKKLDSHYTSGRRSTDWRKLKLVRHQTSVVGGWTEPRGTRPFFGALLLGVYDERRQLQYIGHTGAGFSDAELGRVWKQLQSLATKDCPFAKVPRTNERPHWVTPRLVAEVKFTEWTADRKLRHPTYLGLRDDVRPESVHVEPDVPTSARPRASTPAVRKPASRTLPKAAIDRLLAQIDAIEAGGGHGTLQLPGGSALAVTNLGKLFFPRLKLTKADLFRHYIRVAPFLLPAIADRPLVMKRYPNGVTGKPFYQHRAAGSLPADVSVTTVATSGASRPHLIGGSLVTLLYTVQLASISQDPWFSRIGSEDVVDHVAIDLDPPEGLPFGRVLDVARWVKEELDVLAAPAFPKTSGSGGLHIYVPMPPGTPYQAGLIFCQIVSTMVARKHPKLATVERSLAARGRRVYVDYLQNARGKTLASAYSARANEFAGVSTPLTWQEIDDGVTPQDFTIPTFAARLQSVGDLWAALRKSKGADLHAAAAFTRR